MKEKKSFIKSILIALGSNALLYFIIKFGIKDYTVLTSCLEVPFLKGFVYFYDSWYPYIILIAYLVYKKDNEKYHMLIYSIIFSVIISNIIFVTFPTIMERPIIEIKSLTDLFVSITYKADEPAINCLPSLHCVFCFIVTYYAVISKNIDLKNKIFIVIYSTLIVLSTVFIKQHIIEDIIAAIICTIVSILLTSSLKEKLNKLLKFIF